MEGEGDTRKKFSALLHDLTSGSEFATATLLYLLIFSRLLITEINVRNTSELEWLFVFVDIPLVPKPYLLFRFDTSIHDLLLTYCVTFRVGMLGQLIFL
jgi:hypothetical protein